ncbi:MAG: hypothetical protein AB8U72_03790, partial [Anaplasma ovis]
VHASGTDGASTSTLGGTGSGDTDQTLGGTDQHGTDGTGAGTLKRNGSSISAAPQARSEQDKLSRTLLDTKSTGLWLQNGEFRNENDIALILSNSDLLRAVLFPKKVSAEEYTSHVISRMAGICLGCSNASSLIIKNVSSNAKLEDPQKRLYKVVKTADVSVAGSSDVLGVSVEYKVSKKTHRQGRRRGGSSYTAVCAITNAKLTIKQLDADGVARTSATFGIPNTKSRSVSTPYKNAKIECAEQVQKRREAESVQQHREAEPVQQHQEDDVLTSRTREEEVTAERKAGKWVEKTLFVVESSQDDSKKKKRCFVVLLFWWFVGLLAQLWAYIVVAALWCYNLIIRCCCSSLEKVDNASTVNLRDFTTLQRTKQKPNTYDSGAEKFGNYAHLLQSPIDNADETQEDERMQEDIGPPPVAVVTPEVQNRAPGSVLDEGEVTNAVAYDYSSAAVGA